MLKRPLSEESFRQLCEFIPGGVNSPVRSCKAMGQLPLVVERGIEDLIYDVDGHCFIDYCGSWGALILGHAHPSILKGAYDRMTKGTTFGITTRIEGQLARKITQLVPSIEKIRFVSTGTEATMSAVRLARGYTGRQIIVKFSGHYHGHADFFLVQAGSGVMGLTPTSSSAGIPDEIVQNTLCLPFNDIEACLAVLRDPHYRDSIAAVILEPIAGNMGVVPATLEFMEMLRKETQEMGALLILDEVITGFRVGLQGAQGVYRVDPDLTTLGKIIGGGFPAAAFGGKKEIMDYLAPLGPVYQAGTLSGNPVAMEAGLHTLELLEQPGYYEELDRKTRILTEPVRSYIEKNKVNACIQQAGSMFTLFFGKKSVRSMDDAKQLDGETYAKFFRFMFANAVYIPPLQQEAWFVSSAHKEKNMERTRDLTLQFLAEMV